MPREQKPSVDITNRPSNKSSHTAKEWSDHIHVREDVETRRDIRDARTKLGKLTVRAFAETFCYDDQQVREYILSQLDPDEVIGDIKVDTKALRKLADRVGGPKTAQVVANSKQLREIPGDDPVLIEQKPQPEKDVSEQQVELLRALLKTMDPEVVKRALTGG